MGKIYRKNGQEGIIFGTQIGSIKDGPGIRYVIYFKGCNFKCPWCSNPEGMNHKEEILLYPDKEKFTSSLINSCSYGAIKLNYKGASITNRKLCEKCRTFDCIKNCYDNSRIKVGELKKVEEIISDVLKYKQFLKNDGGITLTGGEPTYQWEFMFELIKCLKKHKLHIALETNGSNPHIPELFPYIDLIIFDLKIMDPKKHIFWTGCSNKQILKNIKNTHREKIPFWIRIPIIPNINDSEKNLKETKEFLTTMKDSLKLELLAYHETGIHKWKALGRKILMPDVKPPSHNKMEKLRKYFYDEDIKVINT